MQHCFFLLQLRARGLRTQSFGLDQPPAVVCRKRSRRLTRLRCLECNMGMPTLPLGVMHQRSRLWPRKLGSSQA